MIGVLRFVAAMGAAAILAGCTGTMSEGQYKNAQAVMGGSPAFKRQIINECIRDEKKTSSAKRREMAMAFNIPLASYPSTFCNRLWNAFAAGRITYTDYRNLTRPNADSSKVIRIMQGR